VQNEKNTATVHLKSCRTVTCFYLAVSCASDWSVLLLPINEVRADVQCCQHWPGKKRGLYFTCCSLRCYVINDPMLTAECTRYISQHLHNFSKRRNVEAHVSVSLWRLFFYWCMHCLQPRKICFRLSNAWSRSYWEGTAVMLQNANTTTYVG